MIQLTEQDVRRSDLASLWPGLRRLAREDRSQGTGAAEFSSESFTAPPESGGAWYLGAIKRPAKRRRPASSRLPHGGRSAARTFSRLRAGRLDSGNVLNHSRQPRQLELHTWPPTAGPRRPAAQSRPASDRCRRAPARATSATTRPTSRQTCSASTARPRRAAGGPGST